MDFSTQYDIYRNAVERELAALAAERSPRSLYEPIAYALSSGGKRVRPALVMTTCEAVGGNGLDALECAVAVEILHNFTLVHDDIMDRADTRRNRPTAHKRWGESLAILAGDTMVALAYRCMAQAGAKANRSTEMLEALTTAIVEVCEGQALDLEFQTRRAIAQEEYLRMIELKTAKMLELAVAAGALAGGALPEEIAALRRFAGVLGLAFQILDDALDATAQSPEFGKTLGGDVIEGKKTYLVTRALEKRATFSAADDALLERFLQETGLPAADAPQMLSLFERNGIIADARQAVERFTRQALDELSTLRNAAGRETLALFAQTLLKRSY